VLIAENTAIRQVQFESDGSVRDVGPMSFGSGVDKVAGAIGVQP
jgi:hypothetical protein